MGQGHADIGRDAFGDTSADRGLLRAIGRWGKDGHGRQGHFVGNVRIVG
jgi:hypothetical protein